MPAVDLNADVGEGAVPASVEAELIGLMTSVSISGGAHAGSPGSLRAAATAAVASGVVIGAHPSYPDRARFGRRPLPMAPAELARSLAEQVTAVGRAAAEAGGELRYVKPHGALYHQACTDLAVARVLAEVAAECGAGVLLLSAGAPVLKEEASLGVKLATEAFCDRAYGAGGALVPRDRPGAVVDDEASVVRQALSVATRARAPSVEGGWVEVPASSLCLHGDTPGAAVLARAVRRALEDAGVQVRPFVS